MGTLVTGYVVCLITPPPHWHMYRTHSWSLLMSREHLSWAPATTWPLTAGHQRWWPPLPPTRSSPARSTPRTTPTAAWWMWRMTSSSASAWPTMISAVMSRERDWVCTPIRWDSQHSSCFASCYGCYSKNFCPMHNLMHNLTQHSGTLSILNHNKIIPVEKCYSTYMTVWSGLELQIILIHCTV